MYNNLELPSIENEAWENLTFEHDLRYSYQISSFGRVRIIKTNYCCIKKQRIGNHKYPVISIRFSKSKSKRYLVHRLVISAFIGNPYKKRTVNHINGIKTDNRISNLEWATDHEQAIHRHYVLNKKTTEAATRIGKIKQQIRVAKYDLNNNLIEIFDSLKFAGESIGKRHQCISLACKGVYKQAYGFIWKYY